MAELLFRSESAEVWCGDSIDCSTVDQILAGRKVDAIICDPPFSARTHEGHRGGKLTADRAAAYAERGAGNRKAERAYNARQAPLGKSGRKDLPYESWGSGQIRAFGNAWHERCRGWWAIITDHVLAPLFRLEQEFQELYPFAPVPLVETGSRCRMTGDGPSNWACFIQVARPRSAAFIAECRTLPGAYIVPGERDQLTRLGTDRLTGGKPMAAMIDIVSDYSQPGQLIADPTCGHGTTLLAALRTGRRCIGIEKDPERAQLCADRVKAELQQSDRRLLATGQTALFAERPGP